MHAEVYPGQQGNALWACYYKDQAQRFIALKKTGDMTAEIFMMGVLPQYHHQEIGTALWESFLSYAKKNGYEYAQVKTVQTGRYAEYDQTNEFYRHLGFRELECFPALWDEWNPCQVYVKYIGSAFSG